VTTPTPTPDHHQPDPAEQDCRCHAAGDHAPACGRNPGRGQVQRQRDGQDRHLHGVGLTDTQRAVLTELIDSAPLPPAHTLDRLRGYLPPAPP
jgi:hypothetical protein